MKMLLKILHLEDNPNDAELVKETLVADNPDCKIIRVDNREDFEMELDRGEYDLIISDYKLPSFDGISALALAQQKCPDTPYLFVSGNIGEEKAIETLKNGATDYILKDRLLRLVPSVNRALHEALIKKEHRLLEEKLRQSQKMEAIGKLTGGIAHDFNNMLTIISGYTEMLIGKMEDRSLTRMGLEEIRKAAEKSSALTRQLLAFSRRQVLQPKVLDLKEKIMNSIEMFHRLIGEGIELVTVIQENLGRIKVDPSQLEQVMLNLVINARDAMPKGGRITLEAMNIVYDESFVMRNPDIAIGEYVMLMVRDTGVGINLADKARIFEPFFTTKSEGKGTGLGLATVFGIVSQSGGYIEVETAPGAGAAFKIYLPKVEENPQMMETETVVEQQNGSETVLLVEDESSVRKFICTILETKGYKVLEVENEKHAISVCSEYKGKIHLLLTDCVMPQMSGKELSQKILALHPEIRVLYVSGYMDQDPAGQNILEPNTAFLQKPFSPDKLAKKVREILDR